MNATSLSQTATYTPAAYSTTTSMHAGGDARTPSSKSSPLPLEIETLEEIQTPDTQDEDNNHYDHHHHSSSSDNGVKSHFPNSATMDSGVEDCCEPAGMQPSMELDETQGRRIMVKMSKQENQGYGFSVVWVSPPRIERLEKDKVADLAGLRIGDLIIGVNGEDVTTVPNTTIYHSMKTTGNDLELEVWRKNPPAPTPATVVKSNDTHIGSMVMMLMTGTGTPRNSATSPASNESLQNAVNNNNNNNNNSNNNTVHCPKHGPQPHQHHHHHHHHSHSSSTSLNSNAPHLQTENANSNINSNSSNQHHHQSHHHHPAAPQQQQQAAPAGNVCSVHNIPSTAVNIKSNNPPIKVQLPPVSILKPPPPAPPAGQQSPVVSSHHNQQRNPVLANKHPTQPTLNSSSWKIRFNVELLDNEEDSLKQFFICELKFFRKVVAALDRYLIPAQAKKLLSPQEIHSIFSHIINIITMTKRILQCVANGAPKTGWRLGDILFSTHSDHLTEIKNGYTSYAHNLGNSALILGEKMTLQSFARFVLETPVPKGHLDITSLLFAPLEHLRNLCEICDEIVHHFDHWTDFSAQLKECYANIVVHTDYMEPISHISMKKHPLLSVRDLEKRIVSTTCQPLKVNEKGRKWLFGSRLFRKETDGSWAPVWAFIFTDIIVLTSHMTRDRVFFVKEAPIRLEDVVTLHFNLPKKNENEFRLVFGPEPSQTHYGRFDRILPIYRRSKSNQICLRTSNLQLKSIWKLLLQRQIITLNTRMSKSSSSNFSISEFCEKFPVNDKPGTRHEEKIDEEPEEDDDNLSGRSNEVAPSPPEAPETPKTPDNRCSTPKLKIVSTPAEVRKVSMTTEKGIMSRAAADSSQKPSSSTSIMSKDPPNRIAQVPDHSSKQLISESSSVVATTLKGATVAPSVQPPTIDPDRTMSPAHTVRRGSKSTVIPSLLPTTRITTIEPATNHVPLILDLTTKATTGTTAGASQGAIVKSREPSLSSVISPSPDVSHSRKSSTGKFTQKPVEMLVSPSEGSPSKSYLNSRKNSAKSESIVNNNNDSLQDMNHVIHAIQESKSECEEDETPILFTTDSPEKSHVESTSTQHSQSMQTQTDKFPLSVSVVEKTQKNDSTKTAASTKSNHSTQQLHHESEGNGKPKDSRVSALLQAETQSKHGQVVGKGNELSSQREGFTANNSGKSRQQSVDDLKTGIKIVSGEVAVGESSTTRIEAGKIMRADLSGPKIMTNAILRSRQQQELMASSTSVVVNSGVSEDSKTCESAAGKVVDDVSKEPIIPSNGSVSNRHVMAPSKRELERNPSQNVSNSCAMGKVYANSPIVSGIGSQRTRRRLLYDYKVRRDYPELFGITPKDRRSFIKRLGELEAEEEKTLVAPYYYHTTLSPLPRPKNGSAVTATAICEAGAGLGDTLATKYNNNKNGLAHMKIMSSLDDDEDDATSTSTGSITHSKRTMNGRAQPHCGLEDEDSDGSSTTRHNPGNERSDEIQLPPHVPHRNHRSPEESSSNDSGISEEILLTNDGHANKNPSSSNTEGSDDMQLSNNSSTSESDPVKSARFPSTLREHEVKTRTVLPPPTARCAATPTTFVPKDTKVSPTANHSIKLRTDNCSLTIDKSSGSSTASVALGQDIQAAKLHTPSPNSVNDDGDVVVVDVDSIKDLHHQNSTTSTSTTTTSSTQLSSHAKMNHVCFVEGATRDGVETVVELASATTTEGHPTMTADKSTGTEDDDYCLDLSWLGASSRATSELTYRQLLADKREAFFTSPSLTDSPPHYRQQQQQQQHHPSYYRNNSDSPTLRTSFSHVSSTSASSYSTHLPSQFVNPVAAEPLVVKIYDGDQVQSTAPPPATDPEPCERVMYTRLEKEKTALVERVESSDDSTSSSSDVASASPAAENGTTDPSWSSSSSSSLAGYSSSSIKEEPSPSTSAAAAAAAYSSGPSGGATSSRPFSLQKQKSLPSSCSSNPGANSSVVNGFSSASSLVNGHKNMLVSSFLDSRSGPAIVVTEDSPETPKNGYSNSDEEMEEEQGSCSIISNGPSRSSEKNEFLRVESNDSTAENYGDDDDYNFDDDDEDLSHCSVATMNRYGTFESLEKLEGEDALGTMPEFRGNMPRSKARFTFDDDDDDDEDLFEEDFESDFNFRFPGQIQDNTYSVSRLGPLPPLLEEDYEDDMYEENRASSESPNNSAEGHTPGPSHHQHQMHQTGVRGDNPFLLARIATMYARSSISPLRIFRELLLKKRYRQWGYKE